MNKKEETDLLTKIILIAPVVALIGLAVFAGIASVNKKTETQSTQLDETVQEQRKIITVEQAESFVGMTLGELCAKYGDYENLSPYSIKAGGVIKCSDDFTSNFYKFIVVEAYIDETDEDRAKQKLCKEDDYSFCSDPQTVYVDVLPESEAREAGVTIK